MCVRDVDVDVDAACLSDYACPILAWSQYRKVQGSLPTIQRGLVKWVGHVCSHLGLWCEHEPQNTGQLTPLVCDPTIGKIQVGPGGSFSSSLPPPIHVNLQLLWPSQWDLGQVLSKGLGFEGDLDNLSLL